MLLKRGERDPHTLHKAGILIFFLMSWMLVFVFMFLCFIVFSLAYYCSAGGNFRSGGGGGQSIFVKGFDSSLPEEDIKSKLSEHFASCGEITRVSVPCDRESGASKGFVTN